MPSLVLRVADDLIERLPRTGGAVPPTVLGIIGMAIAGAGFALRRWNH